MNELELLVNDLQKFVIKDKFTFAQNDELIQVCNIPKNNNYSGLYLFYTDEKELIYIGISGRELANGKFKHRKDGIRGRFLTGKQFGGLRKKTVPIQMKLDKIEKLDIHWFITYGGASKIDPRPLEINLLNLFLIQNGTLPKWNKKI